MSADTIEKIMLLNSGKCVWDMFSFLIFQIFWGILFANQSCARSLFSDKYH